MSKVVITDFPFDSADVETGVLQPLGCELIVQRKILPPAELKALVAEADAIMTVFAPLTAEVIAAMRKVRVIARYGVGVDNVDGEAARARGIPVCNVPDYCMDEVADHTLALMLAVTRRVVPNCVRLRGGTWGMGATPDTMRTLAHLTVGVVGFGRIGREVIQRLKPFKSRILVHDPLVPAAAIRDFGCEAIGWDELLSQSDVLTLHCPAMAQTQRMINRDTLARMKPGAILINAGRGTLVDTAALVDALEHGALAGAGLDVFDPEPLPTDHPLLKMPNVVVSPHVAAVSAKAIHTLRHTTASIAAAALRGEPLPNIVNGVTPRR